jgi:hypothetical protein
MLQDPDTNKIENKEKIIENIKKQFNKITIEK